jgi:hypothetical protein
MNNRTLAVALLIPVLVQACTTSPTGRRQLMLVSEEKAISASEEAYLSQMDQLDQAGKLVTDPAVVERIDDITGRLVAQAIKLRPETKDWDWSVEVIDDPKTVNAWCMAGGRMAIYTGLLQQLDATDDEVAQVMGHEIAHALANHTAERMSVAMASKALAIVVELRLALLPTSPCSAWVRQRQRPSWRSRCRIAAPPRPRPTGSGSASPPRLATTRARRSVSGRRWLTSGAADRRSSSAPTPRRRTARASWRLSFPR